MFPDKASNSLHPPPLVCACVPVPVPVPVKMIVVVRYSVASFVGMGAAGAAAAYSATERSIELLFTCTTGSGKAVCGVGEDAADGGAVSVFGWVSALFCVRQSLETYSK